MVKRVSDAELLEMKEIGEIKYDPEQREVAQFGELIEQLRQMVAGNAERVKADLARSQVQLEVLAGLQKLIHATGTKSQSTPAAMNLEPLREVLAQLHEQREAVQYQFDIQRADNNGPMQRIIATPILPTRH